MDSASILVLLLCAGVVGLLIWFEINSQRNEASRQQKPDTVQSWLQALPRENPTKVDPPADKKKVA